MRKRPATPRWIRLRVFRRDAGVCQLCFGKVPWGNQVSVDHIEPRSRGGPDTIENYQLTHRRCNRMRGTMAVDDFRKIMQPSALGGLLICPGDLRRSLYLTAI